MVIGGTVPLGMDLFTWGVGWGKGKWILGPTGFLVPGPTGLTCSEGIWKGGQGRDKTGSTSKLKHGLRGFLAKLCLLLFVYISLVITQVTETPRVIAAKLHTRS